MKTKSITTLLLLAGLSFVRAQDTPAPTLSLATHTGTSLRLSLTNASRGKYFQPQFSGAGAQFIWSSNLILDNEVLVRFTTP